MLKQFPTFRSRTLLFLVAAMISSPARAQDVAADTPIDLPKPANVRIFSDLSYVDAGYPRQKLDLYLPFPVPAKPVPAILFIHGGGWERGSKADGRRFAFRMVAQGYAVACVDYRLSSDELFPAQIEDCKVAVRWLRANATRYRLDPEHIGVLGVSAGGYLAVLLGTTRATVLFDVDAHSDQSSAVQAVCNFSGPTDLVRLYDHSVSAQTPQAAEVVRLLGGNPHVQKLAAQKSHPGAYLEGNASPFLLVHGTEDTLVPPSQSRLLYDIFVKLSIPVHLHLIHGAGHTGPAFVAPEINAMVDDFFTRNLKPGQLPGEPGTAFITESNAVEN